MDGSVNVPLNHLQERMAEIPRDRRLAVHCAGGHRSSIAAGIRATAADPRRPARLPPSER
jgi:rhodanese-related sulfurtransferase